jgi:outer membrane protein assembly factor BamA
MKLAASACVLVLALLQTTQGWAQDEEASKEAETEFTPVPLIGGNSDRGFGGGVLVSLARVRPGFEPFLWRVELASLTLLRGADGGVQVPYQNHYIMLRFPHVQKDRFELRIRLSYKRESTLKYYGIGNKAPLESGRTLSDEYYQYDLIHPTVELSSVHHIAEPFSVDLGIRYTQTWLDVPNGTKLSGDAATGTPSSEFIGPLEDHGLITFSYGLSADTRDNQVSATRGAYHTVRLDWTPGGPGAGFYYWRANAAFRVYFPLGSDGSAVAMRGVADLLFGEPPIYELARFDQTGAFGGSRGVRGVPGQRYHGKVKFFGNLELRKVLFPFELLGSENKFGIAAFADAGRLFADYARRPDLDGTDLGLKYGLGGGVRVHSGESFVLRTDVAWSPDASPVGVYLSSGHTF